MLVLPTDATDIAAAFSVPTYAENDSVEAPSRLEIQTDQLVSIVGHIEARGCFNGIILCISGD